MADAPQTQKTVLFMPKVRSLLEEYKKLSIEQDYEHRIVPLKAVLSSTSLTGSDDYRPPNTHKAIIKSIGLHLALLNPELETADLSPMGNPGLISDRFRLKAHNARVVLTNSDTSVKIVGDHAPLSLGTLYERGGPFQMNPGYILTPGQNLHLDVSLASGVAAFAGSNTEYGLVLELLLVKVRADG